LAFVMDLEGWIGMRVVLPDLSFLTSHISDYIEKPKCKLSILV